MENRRLTGVLLIYLLFFHHCFGNDIIVAGNATFIKSDDIFINVFHESLIESKFFIVDSTTFKIPSPPSLNNITEPHIRTASTDYANLLIEQATTRIMKHYQPLCADGISDDDERYKRAIPLIPVLIFGYVLVVAAFAVIGYKIFKLRQELSMVEQNLDSVAASVTNLTLEVGYDKYLNKIKLDLSNYVETSENLIVEFLRLLNDGHAIQLTTIPHALRKYFADSGVDFTATHFYYLKKKGCQSKGALIEVVAAKEEAVDKIVCHNYENLGFFEKNFYHRYITEEKMICYVNKSCIAINSKDCLTHGNQWNCSTSSFTPCICELNSLQQCRIASELAGQNFFHVKSYPQFVAAATNAKTFSIFHKLTNSTTTKLTPANGIIGLVLNEGDILIIGDTRIRGSSKNATYIPTIIDTEFTVPPLPTSPAPFDFDYGKYKNGVKEFLYENMLEILGASLLIVGLLFVVKRLCRRA